jgi:hypothetical protein
MIDIYINSFWSNPKREDEQQQKDIVTRLFTDENRIFGLVEKLDASILSAVNIFSISRKIDATELQPVRDTPSPVEVTPVKEEESDNSGILMAAIGTITFLMAEFANNIYAMVQKMFSTITDSIGTVVSALSKIILPTFESMPSDVRRQERQQSGVSDERASKTVEDENEKDERLVRSTATNIAGQTKAPVRRRKTIIEKKIETETSIKRLETTSVDTYGSSYAASGDISSSGGHNDDMQAAPKDRANTTNRGVTKDRTGRAKEQPEPKVDLGPTRILTEKAAEGLTFKQDPKNPVTLNNVRPEIISVFKKIQRDVGQKLVISSTVDDHPKGSPRHNSGFAIDISYSRSPILQTDAGRTLVLKAALKEGVTGIGFEGDHMHIDLTPGMKAHWGGKTKGSGSGFTREQEQLFSRDPRTIVLPPLPQSPPDRGRKPPAPRGWWQTIESYFGASEPAQGNRHHAGT